MYKGAPLGSAKLSGVARVGVTRAVIAATPTFLDLLKMKIWQILSFLHKKLIHLKNIS